MVLFGAVGRGPARTLDLEETHVGSIMIKGVSVPPLVLLGHIALAVVTG